MDTGFKNIRHIILDFGGVIINIDYARTEKAFVDLGISDFGERYSQLRQTDLFNQLEKGIVGKAEFVAEIKKMTKEHVTEQQIIDAWNAMLLDIPLRRLQLLQQLQLHFDLFLLSNTNEIHEAAFNQILKAQCGFNTMAVFFDKVYYSHRVGMRKPDAEIFQMIFDETGINPETTLFVDDSPQHIDAAGKLGLQTIFLQKGMTMEKDIFLPKQ